MGVDGVVTDREFFANLFTCLTRSEFLQNIKLSCCDIFKYWFFRAVGVRKKYSKQTITLQDFYSKPHRQHYIISKNDDITKKQ